MWWEGEVCRSGEGMWDRGTGTGGMGKVCGERGGGVWEGWMDVCGE